MPDTTAIARELGELHGKIVAAESPQIGECLNWLDKYHSNIMPLLSALEEMRQEIERLTARCEAVERDFEAYINENHSMCDFCKNWKEDDGCKFNEHHCEFKWRGPQAQKGDAE